MADIKKFKITLDGIDIEVEQLPDGRFKTPTLGQLTKIGLGCTWLDDCRVPTDTTDPNWRENATLRNNTKNTEAYGVYGEIDSQNLKPQGRFPANLLVENSVLDYNVCRCTPEVNTPIHQQDSNSAEHGTKANQKPTAMPLFMDGLEAQKPSRKLQRHSSYTNEPQNTMPISAKEDLKHLTSEDVKPPEATIATGDTEYGCGQFGSETEINASGAEQPKTSTSTTSNPTQDSQTSDSKSRTEGYCALHATGQHPHGALSQQYSRFFDLDAWAAQTLPFLITPKASKSEKNRGLEHLVAKDIGHKPGAYRCNKCGKLKLDHKPCTCDSPDFERVKTTNHHPTVKPLKLMSYLITLGSRPGDTVLDPFCGSGTTCLAAKQLGRNYIGIEREAEYVEIGRARLAHEDSLVKQEKLL